MAEWNSSRRGNLSMASVTILNYGLGNIQAFANIYSRLNIPVTVATAPEQLHGAEKIVLPGVGSFDWAMSRLNDSGLRETLDELVLEKKVPVIGICVGMQMMANRSEEGKLPGLGWIDAEVLRFKPSGDLPLPHMGWNDVKPANSETLFLNVDSPRYYFLHSYYMRPNQASAVLATATYGHEFAAAVQSQNVFGTQFHPEKSHGWGIDLLRNFAES